MTTALTPRARPVPSASVPVDRGPELVRIQLEALQPHPANRKRFDSHQLDELAESLRGHGQLTPALVRPTGGDGHYQLLAGERRWRAAQAAGLPTLLCLVRELTDAQALEILAIENNQREDVHPLEEAELYKALLTVDGYTPATIAAKLHRSLTYVRERLRLLRLIPQAQGLVYEGRIPIAHAALLAGLSPADQKRAIGATQTNRYDYRGEGLFRSEHTLFDDGRGQLVAVSLAEFRDWIRREVRFDPKADVAGELFPETVAAVEAAEAARAKVLHLTTDHIVHDGARDGKVRTIGAAHWKRADGFKGSKQCPHAELGVVVSGAGQGQAFPVCVKKDQCDVHWKEERKAAERRRRVQAETLSTPQAGDTPAQAAKRKAKQEAAEREAARWAKAGPAMVQAFVERITQAPAGAAGPAGKLLLERYNYVSRDPGLKKLVTPGKTAEDLVRFLAVAIVWEEGELRAEIEDEYEQQRMRELLDSVGLSAEKILDQVAPNEAKPPKQLAGDVRRARKAKKGATR